MDIEFQKAWINAKLTDMAIAQIRKDVYNLRLFFGEEELNFDLNVDDINQLIAILETTKKQ